MTDDQADLDRLLSPPETCHLCGRDCSFISGMDGVCLTCFDNLQALGTAELTRRVVEASRTVNDFADNFAKMADLARHAIFWLELFVRRYEPDDNLADFREWWQKLVKESGLKIPPLHDP